MVSRKTRSMSRALLVALVSCLLPITAFSADCPEGAASPEALIESLQSAAAQADFGTMTSLLPSSARVTSAASFTAAASLMVVLHAQKLQLGEDATPEEIEAARAQLMQLDTRLLEIYQRHKVEPPHRDLVMAVAQNQPEALAKLEAQMEVICTPPYLGELASFLSDVSGQSPANQFAAVANREPGEITTDGDRAVVRFDDGPLGLVRLEGRWYLQVDSMSDLFGAGDPTG